MIRLLLLLLVGTIYAQERDACDHGALAEPAAQGDSEETACPDSQENGSDMVDRLQTYDQSKCHLHKCHNVTMEMKKGICPDKGTCSYRVFNCLRNFWTAQHTCRCWRGNLSSLHNAWANSNLRCLAKRTCANQSYAWIGVYKANNCVGYQNVDGSRLDFTNWACGQNHRYGTWCTAVNLSTGQWHSVSCYAQLPFVCNV